MQKVLFVFQRGFVCSLQVFFCFDVLNFLKGGFVFFQKGLFFFVCRGLFVFNVFFQIRKMFFSRGVWFCLVSTEF